ncbi:hypothetical protein AVEN_206097-1 [Araneus ventricosus]|uniref:Uncharacterized protein n=1 Tax=Araneus ventricosus TaxID=182803 RepID=A0A4Y2X1X1_ARAVE|nr:hypothetical protein AVEN_206097-1 [Araneus ventricosus]
MRIARNSINDKAEGPAGGRLTILNNIFVLLGTSGRSFDDIEQYLCAIRDQQGRFDDIEQYLCAIEDQRRSFDDIEQYLCAIKAAGGMAFDDIEQYLCAGFKGPAGGRLTDIEQYLCAIRDQREVV